jgi:phosphoglycerate kinase
MSFLKHKRSVDDIWPVRGKRVLVRVDFNVEITNGAIGKSKDQRIRAAIPTIRRITDQGGICILMSHMGRPTGHKYSVLKSDDAKRQRYLDIWKEERGAGYTVYFSLLSGDCKKKILLWSSVASDADLFASLSNDEKKMLLKRFKNDDHNAAFPQLRQYDGFHDELTLMPVAAHLYELLNADQSHPPVEVHFAEDCMNAGDMVASLLPGQVLLLENLRFYSDENSRIESERIMMAQHLASYGDFFVSDAFGTLHRRNSATTVELPAVMGHGCCGYLLKKEIESYVDLLGDTPRPMLAIVGGAKVADKISLLEHILQKIDTLIIGGALSFTFLKVAGYEIANSFHESGQSFIDKYGEKRNIDELAQNFLIRAKACNVQVLLPVDHVCHTVCEASDSPLITETAHIPNGYMGLDIGPRTIELYRKSISQSRAVVWNGPMGVFELPTYATGSFSIAKEIGDRTQEVGLISIIGGGSSTDAARMCGHASRVCHVSSGGAVSLDLLEEKVLPGIDALDDL